MNERKCYICGKLLDDEESFVIKFDDESFDLCEPHYQTSKKIFAYIGRRKKELEGKICCKNYGENCEYNSTWVCKNPDCKTPVMETVNMLWDDHLKPLLDNFLDLVGTVIDAGLDIYNSFVAPLVSAFVDFMGPKIKAALTFLVKFIGDSIAGTIDVINAFIDILKGVVNFIAGVFTGDWRRAWDGIKSIFAGVWNALYAIVRRPINLIIDLVNGMTGAIEAAVNGIIDELNKFHIDVPDWVEDLTGYSGFGFDIGNIDIPEIPHLAQGTVVPANYGEFLAVLGDNKRETEVVSPISAIKQAVKEALGENGGSAPQEITVYTYLYPNSAAFHREVVRIMADDRIRKGK